MVPTSKGRTLGEAIMVNPGDLIGAAQVATILGLERSTVTRQVQAGKIPYLAQLDTPRGVYVFDLNEILKLKDEKK